MGEQGAPDKTQIQKKCAIAESRVRSPRGNPDNIQVCGDGIGKPKAYLELNLVKDVEDNNKSFCGSICSG